MTEYWKSQARKYCEFCKCWFADNKVSISFHENGKRHKESVQKHISQLTKKSTKEAKIQGKIDDDMKKMEAAAMAAYLKDVQNNADLTSQSINNMLDQGSSTSDIAVCKTAAISKKAVVWQEVKNEDSSSYFWNKETSETTWDPPDEYVSLAEQEEKKLKEETEQKKKEKIKKEKDKEAHQDALKEAKAFLAREKMKKFAVKSESEPSAVKDVVFGPMPRASKPYGSWTPVVNEPKETIDLQLPKGKEVVPPPVVMQPERIQFSERKVESLGEGPVEFKRRKLTNHRGRMRQKTDDE